jgi:transcriptional regulator with XRE-family HTH domain
LRQLRQERDLTLEAAAELVTLHPIHLGRIEGGQENVTLATLFSVALGYGVPIRVFFEEEDSAEDSKAVRPVRRRAGQKKVEARKRTSTRG